MQPDKSYCRNAQVAPSYARPVLVAYGALFVSLALVYLRWIPPVLLILPALLLSRAMTPFHEYYHTPLPTIPLSMRLIPALLSPWMGGLYEQRFVHFQHHRHLGDNDRDPDHRIIHGSFVTALLLSFFQPERSLFHFMRQGRPSQRQFAEAALRSVLFVVATAALGKAFLCYLVPARILWMINYLAFSRMLHQEPLQIPYLAKIFYIPVFLGSRWLPVYTEHEVHHRFPLLRVEYLAQFRTWPHRSINLAE